MTKSNKKSKLDRFNEFVFDIDYEYATDTKTKLLYSIITTSVLLITGIVGLLIAQVLVLLVNALVSEYYLSIGRSVDHLPVVQFLAGLVLCSIVYIIVTKVKRRSK